MENDLANILRAKQRELRVDLADIDIRLSILQSECKHKFALTGFDSVYFYAKCSCHKSIRFTHGFGESDEGKIARDKIFKTEKEKGCIYTPLKYEDYSIGF